MGASDPIIGLTNTLVRRKPSTYRICSARLRTDDLGGSSRLPITYLEALTWGRRTGSA